MWPVSNRTIRIRSYSVRGVNTSAGAKRYADATFSVDATER